MSQLNRRQFIRLSMMGVGSAVISAGLSGCSSSSSEIQLPSGTFQHGIASGDPLTDRVILWTRVTPENEDDTQEVAASWQVATDEGFSNLVTDGQTTTSAERDYTVKVDAQELSPDTTYFYRFQSGNNTSATGTVRTLPQGSVDQVRLLVLSCSSYPSGYFHAYAEAARVENVNVAVHLGDYIYEYERDGYASEKAAEMGREVLPDSELLSLSDYRQRYAQYRTDTDLQKLHQSVAFIAVWDDHEITNDTWKNGAENHNEGEGDFSERRDAAVQAYLEWMPIRPDITEDIANLQRNFQFGDLVNLIMLDTRLVGRDKQLNMADYVVNGTFNKAAYATDVGNPVRTLLGFQQRGLLQDQLVNSSATWQVLGQQVLMGEMELPAAVATQQLSLEQFAELAALAQQNPANLTPEQQQLLAEKGALLTLGNLPYNQDAWDGYPVERATILSTAVGKNANLVVLAGDTHNGWANDLVLESGGSQVNAGVEFATAGVSSPGLEEYLKLDTPQKTLQTEAALQGLITTLKYVNVSNRGFLTVTFTPEEATAQWTYVSDVTQQAYNVLNDRSAQRVVKAGSNKLT
ncbi:MAG: alkaline phosphatase D family protein [Endozoicomonas sp.]